MPGYFSLRERPDGRLDVRCRACGDFAVVAGHEDSHEAVSAHVWAVHGGYTPHTVPGDRRPGRTAAPPEQGMPGSPNRTVLALLVYRSSRWAHLQEDEAAARESPYRSRSGGGVTQTKIVDCSGCGATIEVPARGRVGERYCGPDCRPVCRGDGCGKLARSSQGLCWGHYQRLRKYGDMNAPRLPTGPGKQPTKPCTHEGCARVAVSYSLCNTHAAALRRDTKVEACTVEGCERVAHARDLCNLHYIRLLKFGDVHGTKHLTHCPQGHEFTAENTRLSADSRDNSISRVCVTCHRDRQAVRRAIKRGTDAEEIGTQELMERDGWVCGLCRWVIPRSLTWPDPQFGTIDHIIPLQRGGRHRWDNVQAAHLRCNMSKNDRMPDEYVVEEFQAYWITQSGQVVL